jgi:hypothetical protein
MTRLNAGDRVRHINMAEGRIVARVSDVEVVVDWDAGGREVILAGYLEQMPDALAAGVGR